MVSAQHKLVSIIKYNKNNGIPPTPNPYKARHLWDIELVIYKEYSDRR
jgi:hypothetical protein